MFVCFLAVVLPMSAIGHKEYRFVFGAIPFFFIILSCCLVMTFTWLMKFITNKETIVTGSLVIAVFILNVYALKQNKLIKSSKSKNYGWMALKVISSDPDATGVFTTVHWRPFSGGYYYLHQKIPYYIKYGIWNDAHPNLSEYVSHVILPEDTHITDEFHRGYAIKDSAAFFKWKTIGNVHIWKRSDNRYPQKMWNHYKFPKYDTKWTTNNSGALPSRFVELPPIEIIEP